MPLELQSWKNAFPVFLIAIEKERKMKLAAFFFQLKVVAPRLNILWSMQRRHYSKIFFLMLWHER